MYGFVRFKILLAEALAAGPLLVAFLVDGKFMKFNCALLFPL